MIHAPSTRPSNQTLATLPLFGAATLLGLLAQGCGQGHPAPITSGAQPGAVLNHPNPNIGSNTFIVDANSGGQASAMKIKNVYWGRLATIRDSTGAVQNSNMVVGSDIRTDNIDFLLDVNAVTEETSVTILHPAGTQAYTLAFQRLDQNLTPFIDKTLSPDQMPPFTLLPRNSAVVVKLDDLLDADTIVRENVRLVTGYPIATPFDCRVLPDINHGDLFDANGDGILEFHTTRVILDPTVSAIEAGLTDPPLPVNNLGLPASINQSQPNVGLRVPTLRDPSVGQIGILTNVGGHGVSFTANGSSDATVSTHDIVRGVRSGGSTAVTGDPNNGFLVDEIQPKLVGVQPVQISSPSGVPGDYVTTIDYSLDVCAARPKAGDILQQPGVFAEVTQALTNPAGGTVTDVHYRIVYPEGGFLSSGPAQISTVWDPVLNAGKEGCFVRYSSVAPGATQPGQGVSSDGRVLIRFSEPMDPSTITAFDNFPILRVNPSSSTPSARDYVVGAIQASSDLKEFSFAPVVNFKHTLGSSNDRFWVNLGSGSTGPQDLAGNSISSALPSLSFTIDPNDATETNSSLVFRFNSADEIGNDGKPEMRGQFLLDVAGGQIIPRPVTRLRATCDRSHPVPQAMPPFPAGIQLPLTGLGCKLQALWRYCDVGFELIDESTNNVDVEHLYWAPAGGNVVADSFDLFEIRLSHTNVLPDESLVTPPGVPAFPNSGLSDLFASNQLDATNDPLKIVHPRERGYIINPADKRFSGTGNIQVLPYPLNQNIPVADYSYYTWRDTSLLAKGAINDAPGAELPIVVGLTGLGIAACPYTNITGTNPVPTIGLPLLMEFRCFPDSGALGLNALDINLATNTSSRPNFRAFSAGGTNSTGQAVTVNPDLEDIAHGGFNPSSTPPGQVTLRYDNTVYLGEMDLVLRVSRVHTIWIDSQVNAPTYLTPVMEPSGSNQPLGTSIDLAFRGATIMSPANANIASDGSFIDQYGNPALCVVIPSMTNPCTLQVCTTNGVPGFLGNNSSWRTTIQQINGAKYFQVRMTFVSNTETNLSPSLSSLGFVFKL